MNLVTLQSLAGYTMSIYDFRHFFIGSVCANYCEELRLFTCKTF